MIQLSQRASRHVSQRFGLLILIGCFASFAFYSLAGDQAHASGLSPVWRITSTAAPTNLQPGHDGEYEVVVTNIGAVPTTGSQITVTDELPAGLPVANSTFGERLGKLHCITGPPVICTGAPILVPGESMRIRIPMEIPAGLPVTVFNSATVSGGGGESATATESTPVSSAPVAFGIQSLDGFATNADGSPATQAGSHPYQFITSVTFNTTLTQAGLPIVVGNPKDVSFDLPPGFVGAPNATPRCSAAQFANQVDCPINTAIGFTDLTLNSADAGGGLFHDFVSVYNLQPPPGVPAQFGIAPAGIPLVLATVGVRSDGDYGLSANLAGITQVENVAATTVTLWGNPADPSHDALRGEDRHNGPEGCLGIEGESIGTCPFSGVAGKPFLTMPTSCAGPQTYRFTTDSWQDQGSFLSSSFLSHDLVGNPVGFDGCNQLDFSPRIESQVSTDQGETGTGLNFNAEFKDEGLNNPEGLAQSATKKAVVTLPEGVTINPSLGEGLGVCTPEQLKRETIDSLPGAGCPNSSKLGSLNLTTPLVEEGLDGSIFLAQQDDPATTTPGAENPFDSLIALYLVLKNPTLGVIVKKPVKIEPDAKTGQLVASLEDVPQIPFSHFNFHFKEGARAPLITPSACGTYTTTAKLYPWSEPESPRTATASFQITKGVAGGPCPSGGVPPFHPEFQAGSVNNNAGAFSPFNMRLIRHDGEQDMTKFSAVLPPGELGSLSGVAKCPDSAVALAKAKTGREELAARSCPANSLIGHTLAGAGVGEALTYVGGQLYLGGPFHGDPLSVISVTPAVAGPFDAGTVVVRLALTLNPKTAEVEVDGANSDPIPHILKGIVLKVRDLRIYVDRPDFTLNPTSCAPSSARATLFGSYLNVFDPSDDVPVGLSTRYQAADCQSLGYKPSIDLQLKGGTRRGGHPGLLATYKARKGDANTKDLVVRLPRSAFLDQSHIRTICTRVQFAAKACPPGAQYGFIKAYTPLLDEPLEGPVYLRSSNHKLPDLVFDLHGLVDVEVATRIDSSHGGIRASIESAPDAPLTKVVLSMQGGKKGLIVNSRNLCGATSKASVEFTGQNGKESKAAPVMKADCGGKRGHKRHSR